MLTDIEQLACLYVHSYARETVTRDRNIEGIHGDLLQIMKYGDGEGDDDVYFYIHNYGWKLIDLYTFDLFIWCINPETGFFIFSDYWAKVVEIQTEQIISFDHKPYLNELLANISYVIKNGYYMVFSWTMIHGFRCTIIGYDSDEIEVGIRQPERFINAFKWKLQNEDILQTNWYVPEEYIDDYDDINVNFSPDTVTPPLSMYIFIGDSPLT